jgi:hypothetical protein
MHGVIRKGFASHLYIPVSFTTKWKVAEASAPESSMFYNIIPRDGTAPDIIFFFLSLLTF